MSDEQQKQSKEAKKETSRVKKRSSRPRKPRTKRSLPPVKIIPLGGLDGIGKNMTIFECGRDMLLVDAGLMFPDDQHPGIDLILADYTYLLENEEKLRGIIITHGHEDHTGALPYVLKDLTVQVPLYSSPLTLGLVEGKLVEHRLPEPPMIKIKSGETIKIGCFTVDIFSVNHSIPDCFGLRIQTPHGNIVHTGDFKFDQTPVDGVFTDFAAISRFSEEGVDLLLSDSTNAPKPGITPSEREVGAVLSDIIMRAKGRVFVASFASQIHRIQQVCDAAAASGRFVAVTGRSMLTNTRIARELGYLNVPSDLLIDSYDVKELPDHKLLVLCTGSQGEPLSALARMASGEHRTLSIEEGDTVIISASPVPGNEKSVSTLVNNLSKIGADVWDKHRALVHVSGHGCAEELKLMLAMVKPRYFMPVHGETLHLKAHAKLAERVGVDRKNIFILDNGDTLELFHGQVKLGEPVESGVVYVDGLRVGNTDAIVLRDRQKLSDDGIITVVVLIQESTQKIDAVQFAMRGISVSDHKALFEEAQARIIKSIENHRPRREGRVREGRDTGLMRKLIRETVSSLVWEELRSKPMIVPIIMEV